MARLTDLRPDLNALMKEDPRAGKKTPVTPPSDGGKTGGDALQSFADRIAQRHDVKHAEPKARTTRLAEGMQEPEVLLNKPNAGERRASLPTKPRGRR